MFLKQYLTTQWLGVILSIAGLFVPAHLVQAATYLATADAHTRTNVPSKNFGTKNMLRVQKWSDTTGFIKFDLNSLAGSTIESATLSIPVEKVDKSGLVTIHRVLGNWGETTISHSNKPAISSAVVGLEVSSDRVGETISVNVTQLLRQMITNGSDSIAFSTGDAEVGMGTRDSGSPIRLAVSTAGGGSANTTPTIVGDPPSSVSANSNYNFVPQSSDADGDTLTHSITNKPAWASFNAGTGRLYGVPGDSDIGVHGSVSIAVSDGQDSATLTPFEIEVTEDGTGSVGLSWNSPTQNTDGTPLRDLAGFEIDWTRTNNGAKGSVEINNPSVSTYVVENLAAGNYEFTIVALNDDDIESAPSNKAFKSVN